MRPNKVETVESASRRLALPKGVLGPTVRG